MTMPLSKRLGAVAMLAVAAAAGCVTYHPVPLRDGTFPRGAVQVGDDVRAETRSGESLAFEVATVNDGVMTASSGEQVAPADLASLEVGRLNKRATFITLGVLGGVLGTAFVLDELEDCDTGLICENY